MPWVVIGIYLFGAGSGDGGPPGFVYGIFGFIFLFFNVFAINMVRQYKNRTLVRLSFWWAGLHFVELKL